MLTVQDLMNKLAKMHPDMPVVVGYTDAEGDEFAATVEQAKPMTGTALMARFGFELAEPGPVFVLTTFTMK